MFVFCEIPSVHKQCDTNIIYIKGYERDIAALMAVFWPWPGLSSLLHQGYFARRSLFEGWVGKVTIAIPDPVKGLSHLGHRKLKSVTLEPLLGVLTNSGKTFEMHLSST